MTKKDLFIGSWVDVGQLLVAARQTVQCINNRVFVIKLFKVPIFTNVELTDTVRQLAKRPKCKYCTGISF
jgi:hypothetical protein